MGISAPTPDGQYSLINKNKMEVRLATYGACVTSLKVPDREGNISDVALGYDSVESYKSALKKPYFGAVVGRYAGRIAKGEFTLDGIAYTLKQNREPNHMHGGVIGFDKVLWSAKNIPHGVQFDYLSPDGEEGYPGNLKVTVIYSLTDKNELIIDYQAITDKATPLNLSNHTYFNLEGEGSATVLDHDLIINADKILAINATSIPTGELIAVKNTPFDFQKAKKVGRDINEKNEQLTNGSGYDHCYVLHKREANAPELAATLFDKKSGRKLQVFTDQPGLQFYTANFLNGTLIGKSGRPYNARSALCLETQHFPDSPNQKQFPNTILRPGEVFKSRTIYQFSTSESINN